MSILITGSNGLVGSEASLFFIKKKYKVWGIDNNLRKFFFGPDGDTSVIKKNLSKKKNYTQFNFDIRNKIKLERFFKSKRSKIKLIIHAAAQPSHDWAKDNVEIDAEVNFISTLNLLKFTQKYCPKAVFIFLSTNKVYGDNPNKLKFMKTKTRWEPSLKKYRTKGISESFNLDNCVHSFFGVSKCAADLLAQEYGKNYNLKVGIFRAGCITGPNHSGAKLHGFLSYLVKCISNNKKYNIIGHEGKQVRDNIHSYDLVKCFWHFFKKPRYGEVYNVGGGMKSNCSVIEAINFLKDKYNFKPKLKYIKKNRTGDHIWWISDLSKFKKHYPKWKQKYNIKTILTELVDAYKV